MGLASRSLADTRAGTRIAVSGAKSSCGPGSVKSIVVDSGPLVALCERLGTTTVASVESDFTIYRRRGRQPFRNLFSEAE